jgi:serine/threonine protein kinase
LGPGTTRAAAAVAGNLDLLQLVQAASMKMSAAAQQQQQQQQLQQRTRIGNYEIGKTLGEGTFAKVKYGRHVDTGASFAIKIIDKDKILKHKMIQQIKREISTMKLVKHPNIVQIFEVLASKTKIYLVLEYVTGGELFNKIVRLTKNPPHKNVMFFCFKKRQTIPQTKCVHRIHSF